MVFSLRLFPVEHSGIFSFADVTVREIGNDISPATGSIASYICDYDADKSLGSLSTSLWLVGFYPLKRATRFVFRPDCDPEKGRQQILFDRLIELMKERTSTTRRKIPGSYTAGEMVFEGRLVYRGL